MRFILFFIGFFFFVTNFIKAQTFSGNNYRVSIGVTIAAGTHFDRLGISCRGYYIHHSLQVNPGFELYYNFKNIGPLIKYFEFAPSFGAVISFGGNDSLENLFLSSLSNQTMKKNSIGYSLNYYRNNIRTSQITGAFSFQFGNLQLITEDDVYAGGIRDEFRTGSGLVQYRVKNFQYGLNFTAWTGKRGIHKEASDYPSRNGYMDMTQSLYGNVSSGLFSAQVQYAAPFDETLQGNIGVDAEQIRNFFQNKLIHEVFFSPKKDKWRGGSDIPMIDSEGNMYLYKQGQKIRPSKLYLNFFANPNLFY
ncbi:MAG: polymorphic toxin type 23 domain-containing protein [Ginsengibacter sp.]